MPRRTISKKSKRRLLIFGSLSVFCIAYFLITLIGSLYTYASLKKEELNLKQELLSLQDEKANLKIEIQKLNDPDYVARYAKEKYLYSSDGEYVIKLNDVDTNKNIIANNDNIVPIIILSVITFAIIIAFVKKKTSSKWAGFIVWNHL